MTYVEVWVDDAPCDGTCEDADEREQLEARIEEAVRLLRSGYPTEALQALTDDYALPCTSPGAIASKYDAWKDGRLPGFVPPPTKP